MGRVKNRRGPLPDVVIRMFDEAWQRWEFVGGVARPRTDEGGDVRRILAVPARQVIATPLWIEGTDAALAPETAKLELEVRGLLPRVQGMDGISLRQLPQGERTLAVAAVFPPELPAESQTAEAFDASPLLLALPRNAATLWREGEDIVVAFTRGDEVVYWETIDRGASTDEIRVWLSLLCLRLRGEAVIESHPRIVSWVEGLPVERIAPEGCATTGDVSEAMPGLPSLGKAKLDWKPVSVRLAADQRVRRERIKRVVLAVASCYIVIAAVLALYFGSLRWQATRLAKEAQQLTAEVEKFQPIARDWNFIAPTLTPANYPLEILGAVVGGMPKTGVRLILFKIEDGQVNVSGEADTFQMATDFYNTLAATNELRGFNLQSQTPAMKPNGSASFDISGIIPTP
ncbi:MAG: hypothetical protein ACREKL_14130 [Chthoniobacterales bacterium]